MLVDAPETLRLARMTEARGLEPSEAKALIAAQMPAAEKRARAHFVVENDATLDALRERAWLVWRKLLSRARKRA